MSNESIAQKLEPTHLTEPEQAEKPLTEAGAKEALEEAKKTPEEKKTTKGFDPNDPKLQEVYVFDWAYTDKRGKLWEGTFTSVIPSVSERANIGAMRARLAGGMPFESLDPGDLQLNFVLAHLSAFLKSGKDNTGKPFRPSWAEDLFSIKDPDLLVALWNEEVGQHEATFFGRDTSS